jgi:hypothetical protein
MPDYPEHVEPSAIDSLILPSTKVAALLDEYPDLEDVLIGLAPPFKKLKNPLLRKSVAKVASLKQAAAVARLPVVELVNTLRSAAGQPPYQCDTADEPEQYLTAKPDWFIPANIIATIDERETRDSDKMTLVAVLQAIAPTQPGQIVELITTFIPAPGIDIMRAKGLLVWAREDEMDVIRTAVSKAARPDR